MTARHREALAATARLLGLALVTAVMAVLGIWLWRQGGHPVLAGGLGLTASVCILAFLIRATLRPATTRHPDMEAIAAICADDPIPCLLCDGNGTVLRVNQAALTLLGRDFTPARLTDLELTTPDQDPMAPRLLSRAATMAPLRGDLQIRLPGPAESLWLRVAARPLPGGLMLWRLEDITAPRLITDTLAAERQYFADFLHLLPVGAYAADDNGTLIYVNDRLAEWLGTRTADLIGKPVATFLPGASSDAERPSPFPATLSPQGDRPPFSALIFTTAYDDLDRTVTRAAVVPTPDGVSAPQPSAGTSAFARLFEQAVLAAPAGVALVEADGTIIAHNPMLAGLADQADASLEGQLFTGLLATADRTRLLSALASGQSNREDPLELRLAEDIARDVTVHVLPLADDSTARGSAGATPSTFALFVTDTSAQRTLEAQFAQAQKMQAMGQLAGGVAHDFNNLLTAIIGFCDLLLQRHVAGDPSFADIMQIKQNANRAANLVRQLLAFSRKQPLQPKRISVTDALSELSHLLNRLLGEAITLTLDHGREVGMVQVDPGQFDQVIINLAVNARDAMDGSGTLTVSTTVETLETQQQVGAEQVGPGEFVRIRVTDTGRGISREDLGRIFEPFFSTKVEVPGAGTGLGLATVYGIVRQTGGFIRVDSAVGHGTTFDIYLPRHGVEDDKTVKAPPAATPPPATNSANPASATILLAEDEDAVRVFAARALRNRGYNVREARSGEGAIDMIRSEGPVDLLITDMMMPGMDGATLARTVRADHPDTPVILISGYSEEVARGEVLGTEDIHFLPKPFSLSQLSQTVQDVLSPTAPDAESSENADSSA